MNHSQQQHMWDSDKSFPTPKRICQHIQQYPWELPNSNNSVKIIDKQVYIRNIAILYQLLKKTQFSANSQNIPRTIKYLKISENLANILEML